MSWIQDLLYNSSSIAHVVMLYAFVISLGVWLGRIKIFGVSLGVTFVLFVGIIMGHFGFTADLPYLHFIKEFGLILFVFCIGLQVGPSFFSSFKQGGMRMNGIAVGVVALNIVVALILYYVLDGRISLPMMMGILSGAVTNTPGLGAAQEALHQVSYAGEPIALGYAVAYPLGVIGIILSIILIRYIFRVNFVSESDNLTDGSDNEHTKPHTMSLEINNQALFGKTIAEVQNLIVRPFIISRMLHNAHAVIPKDDTKIESGDKLYISCSRKDADAIMAFMGGVVKVDWDKQDTPFVSRRILVTKPEMNGKSLGQLKLRDLYGANVTRVNRSGVDLFAAPHLSLQVGDRVTVVGSLESLERLADVMGNSMKRLNQPNIATIFIGILLGILFGSIPVSLGMPIPVKLGLAGGPLVVAILISRFGYKLNLITYTTQSANLMLREIGIVLFLASVGIEAGAKFFETVVQGDGLLWVACGFIITIIPLLIMGSIARGYFKMNYFMLMGLMAGSCTDPPALAYSTQSVGNDAPAVGYSTVYPLVMFMRVLSVQIIILLFS
ncbi:MAG: putative transporter [Bacteroidaceae bacterium]